MKFPKQVYWMAEEWFGRRFRWWLLGLTDPAIRIMNISEKLSIKDKRNLGEWMIAEANYEAKKETNE